LRCFLCGKALLLVITLQLNKARNITTNEEIANLREKIGQKVPLMHISFGQRISDLLGDLMSTPAHIEVKIFGDDYVKLKDLAKQAQAVMQKIKYHTAQKLNCTKRNKNFLL
jgi:cobalt-zinc-cadmium resistance protein CzcA